MRIRSGTTTFSILNPAPSTAVMTIHRDGSVANLEEIHLAGRAERPELLLSHFEEYQVLSDPQREFLIELWKSYDYLVDVHLRSSSKSREYLNPNDPLRLGQVAANRLESSVRDQKALIILHHKIRKSIAGEKIVFVDAPPALVKEVRYRFVANGALVRKGTLPILRNPFEEAVKRAQSALGLVVDNLKTYELMLPLELIRISRKEKESKSSVTVSRRFDRLYPAETADVRDQVILVMALAEKERLARNGDSIFSEGRRASNYKELIDCAEDGLCIPRGTLSRFMNKVSYKGLLPYRGRFLWLPQLLALFKLLAIQEPWKLLFPIYQDALQWAFDVSLNQGVPVKFETRTKIEEGEIRRCGLVRIFSKARLDRNWNLDKFASAVSARLGRNIDGNTIGNFCAGRSAPDFEVLREMVDACNEVKEATPLDPSVCFLGWIPTFYRLLPLALKETGEIYSEPHGTAPELLESEAHKTRGKFKIYPNASTNSQLDPKGLPHLLRKNRMARGETIAIAARRLGIHLVHYKKIESSDPDPASTIGRAGRTFMDITVNDQSLGMDPTDVFDAHWYSYWRGNPIIEQLRARGLPGGGFIDPQMARRFESYASYDFRTPGEIFYTLRNGSRQAIKKVGLPWLPSEESFARALKMSVHRYEALEANEVVPTEAELCRIQTLMAASDDELGQWRQAASLLDRRLEEKRLPFPAEQDWENPTATRHLYDLIVHRPFMAKDDSERFLQKLVYLHEQDRESLKFILELSTAITAPDSDELRGIIDLIHAVEARLRTWPKKVGRKGPLAALYYYNKGQVKVLANRLVRGKVSRVEISADDGSVKIRKAMRPRQVIEGSVLDGGPSFAKAGSYWRELDFGISLSEVGQRIADFFQAVEQRIGMRPNQIQRTCRFPDYNKIRIGRLPLSPYLVPSVVRTLGLSREEIFQIRHLETIMAVARERESSVERGPYWRQGFLLRYFRLLHKIPLADVRAAYRGDNAIEDYSSVELGRVCLLNRQQLSAIVRALRVSGDDQEQVITYLMQGYLDLKANLTKRTTSKHANSFPNSQWLIPYEEVSSEVLVGRLRDAILTEYERRLVQAVVKLRSSAMSDRAGYFEAGRLIRFVRFIVPGLTHEKLLKVFGPGLPLSTYTQWEWGLTAMPHPMIESYSRWLASENIFTQEVAESFGDKLKSMYETYRVIGGLG